MSKFFVEEQEEKVLLSKFIEMIQDGTYEGHLSYPKDVLVRNVERIKKDITDVELPTSVIKELYMCFHSFGGRYDVRTDSETIKGVYSIYSKYPELSGEAVDHIVHIYIKDLFEDYELEDKLGKFIEVFGKTDDAFEAFYDYANKKADELQVKYDEDAKKLEEYKMTYEVDYIEYLQGLIKREHFSFDKIVECMPSAELIKADKEQIRDISERTRIYFGACYPISYSLTRGLVKDSNYLDDCGEFSYVVNSETRIPATFTKEQFLESIKKTQKVFSKKSE